MRILTIDPGLDATGVADWQLLQGHLRLEQLVRWVTKPAEAFPDRLHQLFAKANFAHVGLGSLLPPIDLVVMEKPGRGGAYARHAPHIIESVMKSMYLQNCSSGAMVAGFRAAGTRVMHLQPTLLKKKRKQAIALHHLKGLNLSPPGRRSMWSDDELDAVAIGLQISSDIRLRAEIIAAVSAKPTGPGVAVA